MNSFTILLGLALIAAAYAHGHGSSYVKRTDEHGHHTEIKVAAHGGDDGHGHGHGHGHDEHAHVDYIHHPAYKYEYGVHDPKTKDHHSQWEHRDGDVVKGEYTLDEADGTKRVVKYSSDKHGGFTAHVERVGHAVHPAHYGHHEEGAHHH
ncbi:cuticle protein 19-like [Chironomus tepperi]|uniref:cuticle protein 19-like n=1 Tax=Chironomus tepperi TaxID=113505 RepID=UPI00391F75D5